ncbi:hypothetical protein [Okeania sp. SIO1I7]|uniref:hypothetical protein n=1 Tax=Okeania sp. SIO1I7 TaxID=2607772 RepID=UPI0013FAED42|nr:hypothetical protein [Okeania sp. SIO1I7]NET24772.1 hypothetical protein [Okeania sp. SIO1I7]
MSLSTIITIAIALAFIYLAASFITYAIQEQIVLFFDLKAHNLKDTIYRLLGEEPKQEESYTEKFYRKYLQSFGRSLSSNKKKAPKSGGIEKISAKQFVTDLIELVATELNYKNRHFYNEYGLEKIVEDINSSDCHFSDKMKRDLSAIAQRAINKFQDKGEQLQYLEQELESWFNRAIEYAQENYLRKSKYISIILSVIVVLMFNIDTVNIINKLSKSEITSTISNRVTEAVVSNSQLNSCSEVNNDTEVQTCISSILDVVDGIDNLPVGWNLSEPLKAQFTPLNFSNVIKVVTGWILSIIAISQGAPFWFGILNSLINVKSNKSAKN